MHCDKKATALHPTLTVSLHYDPPTVRAVAQLLYGKGVSNPCVAQALRMEKNFPGLCIEGAKEMGLD